MLFNSFQFLWLFPIIFLVMWGYRFAVARIGAPETRNQKLATKIENLLLIAISYGLYMQWEWRYALVLLGVTAITYASALLLETKKLETKKPILFFTGALLALLPLLVFKYTNFVLSACGSSIEVKLIAPLGISFYTFQAVGYLFDVYYGRTRAERNWWDYMLFVCFFPQLLSGPISKADELLPQIKNRGLGVSRDARLGVRESKLASQMTQGCKWLLWGMFMKVVFADRLGIQVDSIYTNYEHLSGLSCFLGAVLYSMQIYGDFAGYSFMAVGVGELLGFELINNFQRPYLAQSVTEFWRRWHISLTRWLTQNVYIPLGGSRCSKWRQYLNIMVTFLVSGLWHGANWTFIVWGGLHGILQCVEKAIGLDPKGRFGNLENQKSRKLGMAIKPLRILVTFLLVSTAWIFFRMPTIGDAFAFIGRILTDHTLTLAQSTPSTTIFILMSLSIVVLKDLMDEYCRPEHTILHNRHALIRWFGYIALAYLILLCGVFDAGSFIYVNF